MKVRFKVVEEISYELEISEKDFFTDIPRNWHLNDAFHDYVLQNGKMVDISRSWQSMACYPEENGA